MSNAFDCLSAAKRLEQSKVSQTADLVFIAGLP